MTFLAIALATVIYLIVGEIALLLIDQNNTIYQQVAGKFKVRIVGEAVASFCWPVLMVVELWRMWR